jgi:hypothetical protein
MAGKVMSLWHVDIVLDLAWIVAHGGQVPEPKARASNIDSRGRPVEFLFYGDGEALNHLRVIIDADDAEEAQAIVGLNIALWREAVTVTSVMATSHYTAAATLGANSSAHMVWLGDGGAETPFITLDLQWAKPVPADYQAAAMMMAAWPPELAHHLHFLAKFLNPNLPADIRWLQGYRFLEWHFERGAASLQRNAAYRTFLDQHGAGLDAFKRPTQPRYSYVEEVRALMAHALLADRATEAERQATMNAATNTFDVLEGLVMAVLNEIAPPSFTFQPKPPLEPPET